MHADHSFIQSVSQSVSHSVIQSFSHSVIQSFIYSFIHSFIRSLVHSFVRSFIHSFIHSFIRSFIDSLIHASISLAPCLPPSIHAHITLHYITLHYIASYTYPKHIQMGRRCALENGGENLSSHPPRSRTDQPQLEALLAAFPQIQTSLRDQTLQPAPKSFQIYFCY